MNAALVEDRTNQFALAVRVSVYAQMQRFDDALRDANSALEVNANNAVALLTRTQVSLMTNNPSQAARDAVEMLKIRPSDPMARSILETANSPWKMAVVRAGTQARRFFGQQQ